MPNDGLTLAEIGNMNRVSRVLRNLALSASRHHKGGILIVAALLTLFMLLKPDVWVAPNPTIHWGKIRIHITLLGWVWVCTLLLAMIATCVICANAGRSLRHLLSQRRHLQLPVAGIAGVFAISLIGVVALSIVPTVPVDITPRAIVAAFCWTLIVAGAWIIIRNVVLASGTMQRKTWRRATGVIATGAVSIAAALTLQFTIAPSTPLIVPALAWELPWSAVTYLFCILILSTVFAYMASILLAPEFGSTRVFVHTSLVAVVMLLLLLSVYGYTRIYQLRVSIEAQEAAADSAANNLLDLFSVLLATAAIVITLWGFWLQSKIMSLFRLEEQVNDLAGLAVIAAETTFASLPDFSKTQQIPDSAMRTLSALTELVFGDPSERLAQFLDRGHNSGRMQYARALFRFGAGDFSTAERLLREHVVSDNVDRRLYIEACYRLGICQRQLRWGSRSIRTFLQLARGAGSEAATPAKLGIAVTLLGWRPANGKTTGWEGDNEWSELYVAVQDQFGVSPKDGQKCNGLDLAVKLMETCAELKDNTMVMAYYGKCAYASRTENSGEEVSEREREAIQRGLVLCHDHMPEDDNLAINYKMFMAWCYYALAALGHFDHEMDGADRLIRLDLLVRLRGKPMDEAAMHEAQAECIIKSIKLFDDVERAVERYRIQAIGSSYSELIYSEIDECEVGPEVIGQEAGMLKDIVPFLWAVNRK